MYLSQIALCTAREHEEVVLGDAPARSALFHWDLEQN